MNDHQEAQPHFCTNCANVVFLGTKHIRMPGGWCEIIHQPRLVKATVIHKKGGDRATATTTQSRKRRRT